MNTYHKNAFIHLRVHSEFSLVDGIVRIKQLIANTIDQNMPAVAITDQSFMTSLVRFYTTARNAGIKPICGCDVWLESEHPDERPSPLVLLCMNVTGYKNLMELVSASFQLNQQDGLAIVKKAWLFDKNDGLIVLSGGREGFIGQSLLSDNRAKAKAQCHEWMQVFNNRFYLELQRTNRPKEESYIRDAIHLAQALDCPVVATNDVKFINKEDFEAHEARVCINEGCVLSDPRRSKRFTEEQYLKTPEAMVALFSDIPEAIENTIEIAKRCTIQIQLGKNFLPNYPIPKDMTLSVFFEKLCVEGLEKRLSQLLNPEQSNFENKRQIYYDRLRFELKIIIQMGFAGYFLIVMEFIQWAKNEKIPVGPGRGSGAGSLVAYALEITDLDPLEYDLLFERFLNPDRVSMPDFDIDFCMDNRDRVIGHVAETYGVQAVSQIATFGTMAAKAVVKDVARVQGKSYGMADKLSKAIPFEIGMTLEKAYKEDSVQKVLEMEPDAQEVWDMALKLEGITRNIGKHAGGVVIAPTKLSDFSPLYCDEHGHGLVTQYDKNDVEAVGLVKFDFLGLRTLTIIDWALKMINHRLAREGQDSIDIKTIDLADPKAYKLLKSGETTAVFQLESRGMKDLIKRLLPDRFEDIIALVALFRPGPLQSGMVDNFINRKHGREAISYPDSQYQHESLKPILESTYGIILYQEQVMQIAQVLAGYSLGGADMLRRAMGKKKPEEMAKQRSFFAEGAKEKNIDPELAMKIFDLVEKFAGYGFNKSHSAAYALVSYQTLWLKVHFPAEFMAAVLSSDMQNTDKVVGLIDECRNMGLTVQPPNVNFSQYLFTVNEQGEIIYGLGAIKGVGEGPAELIVNIRKQQGSFANLFDFCLKVDNGKINKRCLEALINSGALDSLGPFDCAVERLNKKRAILHASVEDAVKAADQISQNKTNGCIDLFGDVMPGQNQSDPYENYYNCTELTTRTRLKKERDTLGLYLTGHPMDEYAKELSHFIPNRISQLKPAKETIKFAGLIIGIRVMKTKRGDKMAILTLDDGSGRIDISAFSETYLASQEMLLMDSIVIIEGEVSMDDYTGSIKANAHKIINIATARNHYAKGLQIKLSPRQCTHKHIEKLQNIVRKYSGNIPLRLHYVDEQAQGVIMADSTWNSFPCDELIENLKQLTEEGEVNVCYQ